LNQPSFCASCAVVIRDGLWGATMKERTVTHRLAERYVYKTP